MFRTIASSGLLLLLLADAVAAPRIELSPGSQPAEVGQTFEVLVKGLSFDQTSAGAGIGNVTGGQRLDFSFTPSLLDVVKVTIDPRWTFTSGNKVGLVDSGKGTLTGVAFGAFPATTDDDFEIATITLRALSPGQGTLALNSGQFIGFVGGRSGQLIAPSMGSAQVTVVPEPGQWALLILGIGFIAGKCALEVGPGRKRLG